MDRILFILLFLLTNCCLAAAQNPEPAAPAMTSSTPPVRFLALDRILAGATEERIKSLLQDETKAVLNLYLAGIIDTWWFRQDRPGAIFLVNAKDANEARHYLEQLPLAKEGLIDYDLIPIGPYIPLATLIPPEVEKGRKKKTRK